jgi:hypothetical protein
MFESALAKIDRAQKHTDSLETEIAAFRAENTCEIRQHFDPGTGRKSATVHVSRNIPIEWAIVIGEIMYDLRSALDHAITDLTIREQGQALSETEFPIFDDEPTYSRLRSRGALKGQPAPGSGLFKIRGVNDRTRALIYQLQPFEFQKALVAGKAPMLSLLHQLNIVDKHRTIHILRYSTKETSWEVLRDITPIQPLGLGLPVGEIKHGAKVAEWLPTQEPKDEVDMKFTLGFDVAFGEGAPPLDGLRGQSLIPVCRLFATGVREIIDRLARTIA